MEPITVLMLLGGLGWGLIAKGKEQDYWPIAKIGALIAAVTVLSTTVFGWGLGAMFSGSTIGAILGGVTALVIGIVILWYTLIFIVGMYIGAAIKNM